MLTEYLPTGESIRYVSLIRYTGPYKVKSRGTSFYRVYLEDGTVTSLAKIPEDNRVAVISGSPNHGTQKRYRKGCRCRECSTAHAVYVEKMATRRISKEETFFNVAALFAQRSTCNRLHTAAVAVDETNNIIAVGYNGSLPGQPHCSDTNTGCDIVDGHCVRTLHAEQNLICNCANHGKTLNQASIYVLHRPCYTCMKLLIACGVSSVYWLHDYDSDNQTDNVRQVAALSKVLVDQYSITDYTLPVDKE